MRSGAKRKHILAKEARRRPGTGMAAFGSWWRKQVYEQHGT